MLTVIYAVCHSQIYYTECYYARRHYAEYQGVRLSNYDLVFVIIDD
jgi:hypothetical protein